MLLLPSIAEQLRFDLLCWQVKEEEKENMQLKEENLLMTNKTETLKVSLM